jgi:hypothetical protein
MFDDQSLNKSGQIPDNLPLGEPEDIFAASDSEKNEPEKQVGSGVSGGDEPNVMNGPSTALDAGVLKSKSTLDEDRAKIPSDPLVNNPMLSPQSPNDFGSVPVKKPAIFKSILIILVVIFGLGAVVFGAWWLIKKANFSFKKTAGQDSNLEINTNTSEVGDQGVKNILPDNTVPEVKPDTSSSGFSDDAILFGDSKDTDNDGLMDDKERELGTDPGNWDTDGDGLSDGDEVNAWHTNPKNPDTDGDSYKDNDEVKNGYNPNGPGKIFTPPTSSTSTLQNK